VVTRGGQFDGLTDSASSLVVASNPPSSGACPLDPPDPEPEPDPDDPDPDPLDPDPPELLDPPGPTKDDGELESDEAQLAIG
jgi:hypothetical protein